MKVEAKSEELITTLNDLVRINNDRIEGYGKAARQVKRNDLLKMLFQEKAAHSRKFVLELKQYIQEAGGNQTNATTLSGKIYRGWMDIKNTFRPGNAPTILDSCEFGEEAALKAYELALKSEPGKDPLIREKITEQKESILAAYNQLRDISHSLNKILL
jgi:uncharacterized protein (TIGR02284 family)